MQQFDMILTWPDSVDFPLWRKYIKENRDRIAKLIVVFHKTNVGFDYSSFIVDQLKCSVDCFIHSTMPNEAVGDRDWRDVAVNAALAQSTAEWVYFTEQDFLPLDRFWDEVDVGWTNGYDAIGVLQGSRLHPCSLFMKRSTLEKTRKNFGIIPNVADHFSMIQEDLEKMKATIAYITADRWLHMNGCSHNFRLISEGQPPVYQPEYFIAYLKECLKSGVPIHPRFEEVCHIAIHRHNIG